MKMPEAIEPIMAAPCGIDCTVCYVHLKRKKPCRGCLCGDTDKPERCRNCRIRSCAAEKGLTRCYECPDFPCTRIKNLDRSYRTRYGTSLIANGRAILETGWDSFLQSERERWTCSGCGGIVSLHDRQCSECGKVPENA